MTIWLTDPVHQVFFKQQGDPVSITYLHSEELTSNAPPIVINEKQQYQPATYIIKL